MKPVLGSGYVTEWYSSDIFFFFYSFHFSSIWPLPLAAVLVSLLSAKKSCKGGDYGQNVDLPKGRWKEPHGSQEMFNIFSCAVIDPRSWRTDFDALKQTKSTTYSMDACDSTVARIE